MISIVWTKLCPFKAFVVVVVVVVVVVLFATKFKLGSYRISKAAASIASFSYSFVRVTSNESPLLAPLSPPLSLLGPLLFRVGFFLFLILLLLPVLLVLCLFSLSLLGSTVTLFFLFI